jgi:hypothetical protein
MVFSFPSAINVRRPVHGKMIIQEALFTLFAEKINNNGWRWVQKHSPAAREEFLSRKLPFHDAKKSAPSKKLYLGIVKIVKIACPYSFPGVGR